MGPFVPETLSQSEFAALFQEAARPLWGIAAAVTGDRVLADDVLQEAAIVALGKLGSFRRGTSFTAWMGQIVRNVARNAARGRRRGPSLAGGMHELGLRSNGHMRSPEPPVNRAGDLRRDQQSFEDGVVVALHRLGETARACLLLRVVLDLPYREIATLLEIPEGTAMSHVHRARAEMRSVLAPQASPHRGDRR